MSVKIGRKITGYSVVKQDAKAENTAPAAVERAEVIQMHERLERPEVLEGSTYKIRSPLFEHALYVTINDIVLNEGTSHEARRPFEIFINSKNMEHFQWAVALTRIMSAVFRKGGDVTFLVDELKAVFDPRGGYYKSGGVYMSSIVAELGHIVEHHLRKIGLLRGDDEEMPETVRVFQEKRQQKAASQASAESEVTLPANAAICPKCSAKALVVMDGCATCLSCGYSKCG
ncbi:MAG: NrdJb [Xanthomonadales bacterium]|nr:NrdJb [Xanthomonadales bacterium]